MRNEDDVERAVLAPQSRRHPEEKRLRHLTVTFGHAARHVEQEEHGGAHGRLAAALQLPEAQILVGKRRRRCILRSAFDGFLERAAAVEPRTRTAPVPALALPVRILRRTDARL